MIFDGAELFVGDSVFDVAYGSGAVIEINNRSDNFRVAFGARSFTYDLKGHGTFPRKTLFWREPIGAYIPPKSGEKWDMFDKIRTVVALTLGL